MSQVELLVSRHCILPFDHRIETSRWEGGVIALRLVKLIENHSDELVDGLLAKFEVSSRTTDLKKVPTEELRGRIHEILDHLSEWLLTKTNSDIENRYRNIGARRAAQGVSISDYAWAIVLTKEHLWDFLQRQGFLRSPVELYGEMELLRLLDQFFDRAICYATEGYEQHTVMQEGGELQGGELTASATRNSVA
jgi:hypothetical protein